jgi:pimeloyl-ACP methyl ester carboxylesterase
VIRLDLPGFGLTGPFQDGASSLARTLGVIERLLDTLGAPRVIVAGNSLGGLYAWQLAVRSPTRVAGLILVDPAGYPSQATSVPVGFKVAALPGMRYVASQVLPRRVIESSVRNVYGDPSRVTPELVDRYYELTLREGNRRAFTQRPRTGGGGSTNRGGGLDTLQIATIRAPTLILWGELDRLIPPSNAARFARDIPGSRVVRFPTLGHVPHEEDPVASLAPVREFLGTIPR